MRRRENGAAPVPTNLGWLMQELCGGGGCVCHECGAGAGGGDDGGDVCCVGWGGWVQ